jgi:serine/threonine protein kinase
MLRRKVLHRIPPKGRIVAKKNVVSGEKKTEKTEKTEKKEGGLVSKDELLLILLSAWKRNPMPKKGKYCVPSDIVIGRPIAQGSYGKVSEACRRSGTTTDQKQPICDLVIKETKITNMDALETTLRDIYFLLWMQQQHSSAMVTPRIHSITICGGSKAKSKSKWKKGTLPKLISIVMERFDQDVRQLYDSDDSKSEHTILNESDLLQMFTCLMILDRDGITHGDLKPDQFLWRKSDGKIVISDFGLAGQIDTSSVASIVPLTVRDKTYRFIVPPSLGWPVGEILKCGDAYARKHDMQPGTQQELLPNHPLYQVLPYMNLWQLHAYLLYEDMHVRLSTGEVLPYAGLDETLLPAAVEQVFGSNCSAYKTVSTSRREKGYVVRASSLK